MTPLFVWSPVFETGLARIDEQHHYLVDLINEAALLLADEGTADPGGLIDRLATYAAFHFGEEERLMVDKKLDPAAIAEHAREHREFAHDIDDWRHEIGTDGGALDRAGLLGFLARWLACHILGTDQLMAEQVRRVDTGESAADAQRHAREPRDAAVVRPLLDALGGLRETIARRNRTLRQLNDALRQAETELRDTNRELESRVAARTRELEQEKSELAATLGKLELTQAQLLQSEKMAAIGQLAAGVAHEINNPIGFVNSNLASLGKYVDQLLGLIESGEALLAALPEDDARRQRYEALREAADLGFLKNDVRDLLLESASGMARVKKIVQDLKDFSHVDHAEWSDADLNAGLDSTLNMLRNEIKYKAEVVKEYGVLPPVHCIATQINQVFMNLLVNAAQAIAGHGIIIVRSGTANDLAWIEIADNGAGMSETVRRRIFEPFFTTKPVGKGTGLGLSISWEIVVKKHGGALTVESQPGVGTTFRVELPIAGATASPRQAPSLHESRKLP